MPNLRMHIMDILGFTITFQFHLFEKNDMWAVVEHLNKTSIKNFNR